MAAVCAAFFLYGFVAFSAWGVEWDQDAPFLLHLVWSSFWPLIGYALLAYAIVPLVVYLFNRIPR